EPQREPVAREQRADARRTRDGAFERRPSLRAEHRLAVVEVDQAGGASRGLILSDHQLAGARDGGPVDPTEIVALLVAAHRVVLLPGSKELAGARAADVRHARRLSRCTQVLDLRRDEQLVAAVEQDAPARE